MGTLRVINAIITAVFLVCYSYQFVYIPLVWILKNRRKQNKLPPAANDYAVLICARNESAVIGDLLESIYSQTYDKGSVVCNSG